MTTHITFYDYGEHEETFSVCGKNLGLAPEGYGKTPIPEYSNCQKCIERYPEILEEIERAYNEAKQRTKKSI